MAILMGCERPAARYPLTNGTLSPSSQVRKDEAAQIPSSPASERADSSQEDQKQYPADSISTPVLGHSPGAEPDPTTEPGPVSEPMPLPKPIPPPLEKPVSLRRVAGLYYPNWTEAPPRVKDIDLAINVIYLFAAKPVGGSPGTTGEVIWTAPGDGRGAATNLKADIQYARSKQNRKIILAVGGAGAGMSFPNHGKSQTFVKSISKIIDALGGLDGLDWNTFEADLAPDTAEMIWISLELKKLYPGFMVSAPPAPWNPKDKAFCAAMVKAGALDFAAPQYYDGPDLATIEFMEKNLEEWITLLGANHVAIGFGIWNKKNYMTIDDALESWRRINTRHPTLAGAFAWSLPLDEEQGWPFTLRLAPLINPNPNP